MILTCPDCATRYSAKSESIGVNGRTVRCSKCDATWFIEAQEVKIATHTADEMALRELEAEADLDAVDMYQPPVADIKTETYSGPDRRMNSQPGAHVLLRRKKDREQLARKMNGVRLIWGAALSVLLVAVVVGLTQRHEIVKKHPSAATLYQAFSLPVSQSGLSFGEVITRTTLVDGQSMLVVNGSVRSNHGRPDVPPFVELAFLDVADKPITTWLVDLPAEPLRAKGQTDFAAQYPNPPLDAVALRYRFAAPGAISDQPER